MSVFGKIAYKWHTVRTNGFRSSWYRYAGPRYIESRPPIQVVSDAPEIHSVGGEEQYGLFICMLESFLLNSNKCWSVYFHDDGTLRSFQRKSLEKKFPGIRIISREESDKRAEPYLEQAPSLANYREKMPHALKCLDSFVFAQSEKFILIDPDIIFFSRPVFIDSWIDDVDDLGNWFNRDPQEPSPYDEASSLSSFGFRIWSQVNSGLCLMNRNLLDVPFMESCFKDPVFAESKDWRKEQTLLALLASRRNVGGLLPSEYSVTLEKNRNPQAICRHYVGVVRSHFWREGVSSMMGQR